MGLLTLIASFVIVYLAFNVVSGFLLCIYYFYKERKITNSKEFLNLLLFPATGLGSWIFNRNQRNNLPEQYNDKWYICKNMIRLNWVFILLIIGYECYAFSHLYIMYHQYSTLKKDATDFIGETGSGIFYAIFGWMFDLSLKIVFGCFAIILIITFIVFSFVLILIPKLQLGTIEKQIKNK